MSLNIVFFGTPEFGLPCLKALADSKHRICAVYTQPDRPSGRGQKLQSSPVKTWALEHKTPVFQPTNFKDPQALAQLAALKPDVFIVIAYGLILPKVVLDIPRFGGINVHASLLPRWRGAAPIPYAILKGDTESGITIMQMNAGMDSGSIIKQSSTAITEQDTSITLHNRLAQIAVEPLLDSLDALEAAAVLPEFQKHKQITYAPKIIKSDAQINWCEDAISIDRMIRAYQPWPIAYTHLRGEVLRIHKARVYDFDSLERPGTILHVADDGMLVIAGNQQCIMIEKIQFPNGNVISVADWLNSGKVCWYDGLRFDARK